MMGQSMCQEERTVLGVSGSPILARARSVQANPAQRSAGSAACLARSRAPPPARGAQPLPCPALPCPSLPAGRVKRQLAGAEGRQLCRRLQLHRGPPRGKEAAVAAEEEEEEAVSAARPGAPESR